MLELDFPLPMTDPSEDLKGALHRIVTAIVTLESTEGARSRQAYSELVAATSHAKKVLHEHGLPVADESAACRVGATEDGNLSAITTLTTKHEPLRRAALQG
jgi:hypothetical protein